MKYDQNIFKMPESIDKEKYIICTYFCEGYTSDQMCIRDSGRTVDIDRIK